MRDFTYDEEAIEKGKRELDNLVSQEKQLWVRTICFRSLEDWLETIICRLTKKFPGFHFARFVPPNSFSLACFLPGHLIQADLLRLSRINFSELFQLLVHLKVVRAYVESVLRYGLPASYFAAIVKVSS